MALSQASAARIKRFVDWFIRSQFVSSWSESNDNDWINEPDRANRVYEASAEGCDGRTHYEVISDWREAFSTWINDRRSYNSHDRFEDAVRAHFDSVEQWHEKNGSLHQEIG